MVAAACLCSACATSGADHTPATEPSSDYVLTAELRERPPDFPSQHVRAALAWVDGRPLDEPETSGPDDLRELRFELNSDVAVRVSFPLRVVIPIQVVEPMHYEWLAFLSGPDAVQRFGAAQPDRTVYSLPQAEVVLYLDGNHDQRLNLVEPGEPGPGPDRVLAVGSGLDAQGQAERSVVVHKKFPFEPPLELFVRDWGPARGSDGVYVVRMSVGPDQPLAQQALLSTHGIIMSNTFDKYWARNFAQHDIVYSVQTLDDTDPLPLFTVGSDRKSWLARGCVPYPTGHLGYSRPPPPGAAVQCGADLLTYASSPEDYCGQSDTFSRLNWRGAADLSFWPCDEHGLIPGSPYVAASQRIGISALSIRNAKAYTGLAGYPPPADFRCRPDIIYDFDDNPQTHLPAQPPPSGSQVMCYGHDALSFVPSDADCRRKFTYDLSSDDIPGYTHEAALRWDLRDDPPAWWPCDAHGDLIPDSPYQAPQSESDDDMPCPEVPALAPLGGEYPPPPHTKIRCTSATRLIAVPRWSDHCDGRTETALSGDAQTTPQPTAGWKQPAPDGWPCDADGHFVPTNGYQPL